MLKASIAHRTVVTCPVCSLSDFTVRSRTLGAESGHVVKHCRCERCGASFHYDEDRFGRPVVADTIVDTRPRKVRARRLAGRR